MIASTTAYAFIIEQLRSSPELMAIVGDRVFQGVAPAAVKYPLILVQPYGQPDDIYYNSKLRAATRVTMSVRVVAQADSLSTLEPAALLVDQCLQGTGPEFSDRGYIAACVRTSETEQTEIVDTHTWRYLGGIYELIVTSERQ